MTDTPTVSTELGDPFLSTMTFATTITKTFVSNGGLEETRVVKSQLINNNEHRWKDCDCSDDECRPRRRRRISRSDDVADNGSNDEDDVVSFIPPSIQDAIDSYKRQKKINAPIKRRQVRRLVYRDTNIHQAAVWEWMLPVNAESLLEYSNPEIYRIVWIQHLPHVLQTIGKGIIGSNYEERTRENLDWKEGDVILIKSNDSVSSKAIGWIHHIPVVDGPDVGSDTISNSCGSPGSQTSSLVENQSKTTNQNNLDDDNASIPQASGPAVLYIIKIPFKQALVAPNPIRGNEIQDNSSSSNITELSASSQPPIIQNGLPNGWLNLIQIHSIVQSTASCNEVSIESTTSVKLDEVNAKIIKSTIRRILKQNNNQLDSNNIDAIHQQQTTILLETL
jgi:hypothetical protein